MTLGGGSHTTFVHKVNTKHEKKRFGHKNVKELLITHSSPLKFKQLYILIGNIENTSNYAYAKLLHLLISQIC